MILLRQKTDFTKSKIFSYPKIKPKKDDFEIYNRSSEIIIPFLQLTIHIKKHPCLSPYALHVSMCI